MPSFQKSSPELIARFNAALPKNPVLQPRKMFGYPCSFVNGWFFAGLHEENVVIRLTNTLSQKLPALAGAEGFDPMRNGKGMKDWFVVPTSVAQSEAKLKALLATALQFVSALPPKAAKKRAPKK